MSSVIAVTRECGPALVSGSFPFIRFDYQACRDQKEERERERRGGGGGSLTSDVDDIPINFVCAS